MPIRRVGILTGGGDCSGLNAVIRAVTRAAIIEHGWEVIGIENGFEGLIFDHIQPLTIRSTRDILTLGGTILGTSNKGDPFVYRQMNKDGSLTIHDYSARCVENFQKHGLDTLFVVGGEGSQLIGYKLHQLGCPVIGIPKTIDNDLEGTDYSFGFHTAVQVAVDALDRIVTTGKSHQRVMILEVMGRNAGWIALEAGVAGGAHIILIPEIPYDLAKVKEKIRLRAEGDSPFSILVAAEGALEQGGAPIVSEAAATRVQGKPQLGGVGAFLAGQLGRDIDLEVRCTVLGYVQRGGTPTAFDRLLGTRLGTAAVRAAAEEKFGHMVALRAADVLPVPLAGLAGKVRTVPLDHSLIRCA
ncbi:MAG: 6-phosphofructokinase, partial [Nitrospinaceae bacterium]